MYLLGAHDHLCLSQLLCTHGVPSRALAYPHLTLQSKCPGTAQGQGVRPPSGHNDGLYNPTPHWRMLGP